MKKQTDQYLMLMDASPQEVSPLRKAIHDINGEIFLIRGNAEVAVHHLDDNDAKRKNLDEIIARSEVLEQRVRQLRALLVTEEASTRP